MGRAKCAGLVARVLLQAALITVMLGAPVVLASERIAKPSRALSATDTAHLKYLPKESEGSTLVEEGSAAGQLPGRMRARLSIGATFSGSFVLRTSGGSISGHGSAIPAGSGRYESFHGSLIVSGGTGRYAHAHGRAGLFGVFDRQTYAFTVQTTGHLSY